MRPSNAPVVVEKAPLAAVDNQHEAPAGTLAVCDKNEPDSMEVALKKSGEVSDWKHQLPLAIDDAGAAVVEEQRVLRP